MNEPVSTIMARNLYTLSAHDPCSEAQKIFREHTFHHIPVVRGKELVGMLSKSALTPFSDELLAKMEVEDLMIKKLVKISSSDKIGVAAEIFLANHFHALPIADDGELVGIVTTFDIIHYCFLHFYPGHDAITIPDKI